MNQMDPFRNGAAGVVSSAKSFRPEQLAELTTPSAAPSVASQLSLMPQPPLLFKEGNAPNSRFRNSFTPSMTAATVIVIYSRSGPA
jgi:hypothetical protein